MQVETKINEYYKALRNKYRFTLDQILDRKFNK